MSAFHTFETHVLQTHLSPEHKNTEVELVVALVVSLQVDFYRNEVKQVAEWKEGHRSKQ